MSFNWQGLVLTLLILLICLHILILDPIIKQKFPIYKQITNHYFFWLIIGLFCFIWLIIYRYAPGWSSFIVEFKKANMDFNLIKEKQIISRAFLLDVCPFAAMFLCLSIMFDPSRRLAKCISPLCIIGGAITTFSFSFIDFPKIELTWECIFTYNDDINRSYVFTHAFMLIMTLAIFVNTPKFNWKEIVIAPSIVALFFCYVAIIMTLTGCNINVSGLSINDWDVGEYQYVAKILNLQPIQAAIVGMPLLFLVGLLIIWIKNLFSNKWIIYQFGNYHHKRSLYWYDYQKYIAPY